MPGRFLDALRNIFLDINDVGTNSWCGIEFIRYPILTRKEAHIFIMRAFFVIDKSVPVHSQKTFSFFQLTLYICLALHFAS